MKHGISSYKNYSQNLIRETADNDTESIVCSLISLLKASIIPKTCPVTYLHHYQKRQYPFVSTNVTDLLGYTSEDFLEGGTDFLIYIHHKDDFKTFSEELFRTIIEFLSDKPVADYLNYKVTYNYRLKHKNGKFLHILQQCSYLDPDKKGHPMISFGTCTDITVYKADNRMHLGITKTDEGGTSQVALEKNFFPNPKDELLSGRELEILKWVTEGLSSKQIADKLFLSTHTINTHRKNMLLKTNAKNTADLIRYAVVKGII